MLASIGKYTFRDYANLEEGAPYQLIGGDLVLNPAPTPRHQRILADLGLEIKQFLRAQDLGTLMFSPVDVYFSETETYQPDLIVILNENRARIGETKIEGAPDLVLEVLSPSTAYYDLKHKKDVYQRFGVKEYWLVDPMEQSIELLFNENGVFQLHERAALKGPVQSRLLEGLRVELEAIF